MKKNAIIVAAGSGKRFGGKKQFTEVNGKPLYYYSIKAFEGIADKIILVVPEEDIDKVENYGAVVVAGGTERYDSVYNGLKECDEDSLVAIHDAARPGVTKQIIEDAYAAADEHGAAVPVVPVTDTIRTVDGELIDRNQLRAMQTPQTFRYDLIKRAYDELYETDGLKGMTDDVEILRTGMGIKSFFTEGSSDNLKVTNSSDLERINL